MTRERDDIIRLGKCFCNAVYDYEQLCSCLEEEHCVRLGTLSLSFSDRKSIELFITFTLRLSQLNYQFTHIFRFPLACP